MAEVMAVRVTKGEEGEEGEVGAEEGGVEPDFEDNVFGVDVDGYIVVLSETDILRECLSD